MPNLKEKDNIHIRLYRSISTTSDNLYIIWDLIFLIVLSFGSFTYKYLCLAEVAKGEVIGQLLTVIAFRNPHKGYERSSHLLL